MYIHRLGNPTSSGRTTLAKRGRTLEGTSNFVARNMLQEDETLVLQEDGLFKIVFSLITD